VAQRGNLKGAVPGLQRDDKLRMIAIKMFTRKEKA